MTAGDQRKKLWGIVGGVTGIVACVSGCIGVIITLYGVRQDFGFFVKESSGQATANAVQESYQATLIAINGEQATVMSRWTTLQAVDVTEGATATAIAQERMGLVSTQQALESQLRQLEATFTPGVPQVADLPTSLPYTATPIPTPTPTFTPSPTATPIPTPTPTPTITPTPTNTPTPTSTPTPTPTPLVVGDEWSDDRVTLTLIERWLDAKWTWTGTGLAVAFRFEFKNHSGETILLRFSRQDFTLVDNVGRSYECHFPPLTGDDISETLPNAETYEFSLGCGVDQHFDREVSYVVVSIEEFSSLGPASWKIDVPR